MTHSRIRKIVESGGRHSEKWKLVHEKVYEQFVKWRNDGVEVHDADLCDAALLIADSLNLHDFKVN